VSPDPTTYRIRWGILLSLCLATACGKVGEPRPPYVRIPERVHDFAATQSDNKVVLSWTNPAHNLDGSTATDLAVVHITSNGAAVADVAPTGPGKSQSYAVPAQNWIGQTRTFNVWLETARHKQSDVASVRAQAVEVPGAVANLKAIVDQYAINLTWDPPQVNRDLSDGYFVRRTDRQTPPELTTENQFKDSSFDFGKTYIYEIVSARHVGSSWITGTSSAPLSVAAVDKTPPHIPGGLAIVVTDSGAIVTWDPNQELDLKGYFVYRNGHKVNPAEPQTGNSFADPDYKPNTTYSVSAIDQFGNESQPSPPIS